MPALDAILLATAAVITSLGGALGAIMLGVKQLAEARATRATILATRATAEHTATQGHDLAAAIQRIEAGQAAIRRDLALEREARITSDRTTAAIHSAIFDRLTTLERKTTP